LFGWSFLLGTGTINNPPRDNDRAQHIIGQRYFIADTWRWPLLNAHRLVPPHGTNIAFTDSIPFIALAAKIFKGSLPAGFEAVSLWLALSWTLLPPSAVFALRSAGEQNLVPSAAGSLLVVSMPIMFWRSGHEALSSHFLILLALGLYFRIARSPCSRDHVAAILLMIVSLLVHPYIMVMVLAVLVAAPLTVAFGKRQGRGIATRQMSRDWPLQVAQRQRQSIASCYGVFAGAALTAGLAVLLGYTEADRAAGFGYYSMNVLSPIHPAGSAILWGGGSVLDATGGQFEGYQYLGLGSLILCAVTLARHFREVSAESMKEHLGLTLVCALLFCFALSNRIYIGSHLLASFDFEVPQFRATGRFFWPVAYVLALATTMATCRVIRRPYCYWFVVVAAVVQFADTSGLRRDVYRHHHAQTQWLLDADRLRALIGSHTSLTIWPIAPCAKGSTSQLLLQSLLVASEAAIPVNTMYVARLTSPVTCDNDDAVKRLPKGELRLFLPEAHRITAMIPYGAGACRHIGPLIACSAQFAASQDPT